MTLLETTTTYLGNFNRFVLEWFVRAAMVLAGIMTAMILIQVFFRYCLNNSLPWPEEFAKFTMVWMTFLVAPYAYRKGLNVSMELFISRVPQRIRSFFQIVIHILLIAMAYYLLLEGLGMMKRGMRIRASSIDIKMAYVYLILPVSFVMMMIGGVEHILKEIKNVIAPVVVDAAAQPEPVFTGDQGE